MVVENAEVWKNNNYFIVKPHEGRTRRFLNIYSINDTKREKVLESQIFEVLDLPKPYIYFGDQYSDTIHRQWNTIPKLAHFLDKYHLGH